MLTTAPGEKFGSQTVREHYERIAAEGQEYDPYTTMLAFAKKPATRLAQKQSDA
jgi:divinyl chlorophyllide a 8-vinyl-reductase